MDESKQQNRHEIRHRTLKEGLVSFNREEMTVPCLVRDESDGGARLQFNGPVNLPQSFHLTIPLEGAKYPVEVQWMEGMTCGVRFTGPAEPSTLHHHQYINPYRSDAEDAPESGADAETPAAPSPTVVHRKPFGRRK